MPVGHEVMATKRLGPAAAGAGSRRRRGRCRGGRLLRRARCRSRFGRKQCERGPDNVAGIADGLAGGGFVNRLASEARRLDANVGGKNHHVRRCNVFLREDPFFAGGALRFDLDLMTK